MKQTLQEGKKGIIMKKQNKIVEFQNKLPFTMTNAQKNALVQIEDDLKRFKRQCARNGVLKEVRKRESRIYHNGFPYTKGRRKGEKRSRSVSKTQCAYVIITGCFF